MNLGPVHEIGLAGRECRQLDLVSYGYQRQIWVWVHMRGRLTSASCQLSLCLKDVDDHQLPRVSRITKGHLSSTGVRGSPLIEYT